MTDVVPCQVVTRHPIQFGRANSAYVGQTMSFDYVNHHYGLALKRGSKMWFEGRPAQVMSATNLLHVRFTDGSKPKYGWLHPMWHTEYPAELVRSEH